MMNHPANTVFVRVPSPSITSQTKKMRTCASVVAAAQKLMKFEISEKAQEKKKRREMKQAIN